MHNIVNRLITIKKEIQSKNSTAVIVAITKTFPIKHILPLINYGHHHFGENKVQEAVEKWTETKKNNSLIKFILTLTLKQYYKKYQYSLTCQI